MMLQRLGQNLIITVFGLATLGAVAWLALVDHGPRWWLILCVALILSAPVVITLLYVSHDLLAERGRGLAEMRAAGYVQAEEEIEPVNILGLEIPRYRRFWEWVDFDGDGEVDPGEIVPAQPTRTYINRAREIPPPPLTPAQKARAILSWCYDRAEKNLGYGQNDRGDWTRPDYDAAMKDLKHIGLVRGGGKQGSDWRLVIVPPAGGDWPACRRTALTVFDHNVTEE